MARDTVKGQTDSLWMIRKSGGLKASSLETGGQALVQKVWDSRASTHVRAHLCDHVVEERWGQPDSAEAIGAYDPDDDEQVLPGGRLV